MAERRLGYRDASSAPWRRKVIDLCRPSAIGDVLMCTPVLRELKRLRPERRTRFYTDFPTLVRGLPYIDEVLPASAMPFCAIPLEYEAALPLRKHLAAAIGDSLGVAVGDIRPDCVVDRRLVRRFRRAWHGLPRPHIVLGPSSSDWSPNKNWPEENWGRLIRRLSRSAGVIETGSAGGPRRDDLGPGYVDLRGRTSLDELVAVIAAADLHIGVVSAPLHIAAAVGTPSVAIVSGYEHPSNTVYAGNIVLYTAVECAPCWLRTPCPNGLKCLRAISPEEVEAAALRLWRAAAGAAKAAE
jgi:ADP-heptose:LPS heptosyltransferase